MSGRHYSLYENQNKKKKESDKNHGGMEIPPWYNKYLYAYFEKESHNAYEYRFATKRPHHRFNSKKKEKSGIYITCKFIF